MESLVVPALPAPKSLKVRLSAPPNPRDFRAMLVAGPVKIEALILILLTVSRAGVGVMRLYGKSRIKENGMFLSVCTLRTERILINLSNIVYKRKVTKWLLQMPNFPQVI